jgi:integrase
MPTKLTTEDIRTLANHPPRTTQDIRDAKQPGLILRIRPSGTFTYRVQLGRGRSHTLGTTDDLTLEAARLLAQGVRGDVSKAKALGQPDPIEARRHKAAVPTFDEFLTKHYEPWATAQRKTGAEQVSRLRGTFGALLNGVALDEITGFTIERWRSGRLKDDIRPATINRDLNTLRGALSRAVEWGMLPAHPLAKVKASKVDTRGIVRYLDPPEEKRLRAALAARDDARRDERQSANRWRLERGYEPWPEFGTYTDHLTPIVILAMHTGLRRGELFGLRWRDVDLMRALLTVRGDGAKSGQTRHIPLNTEALAVLNAWRGDAVLPALAYVFPSPLDADLPLVEIKSAFLPLLKAAKITEFRFHDLRHHFASRLVQQGVDLNTVRELLGHADLKMTLRYAHLAPELKAAAVAKLVSA